MTRKVFWEDPYQTELDTTVMAVNGTEVTLAETILYALAGGQESDRGTIAEYEVLSARKDNFEIFYTLPANHSLQVGDAVHIQLN